MKAINVIQNGLFTELCFCSCYRRGGPIFEADAKAVSADGSGGMHLTLRIEVDAIPFCFALIGASGVIVMEVDEVLSAFERDDKFACRTKIFACENPVVAVHIKYGGRQLRNGDLWSLYTGVNTAS
ncbi:unnamed protein product [Hydatigera taeniaeformis]|uniref:Uncharacterized protein n=1 Tax=Hydatigena taeniaeformis TaxID=6205 RepID=A0A0R3X031_HYDTA|nr:unnamed protein product [Hydatigera taeniaeformis]